MAKAQWEDGNPKPKGYLRPTYYEKGQGRDGYLRL